MLIFLLLNILISGYLFASKAIEEKQHFFYDKDGILSIDGSVAGQSEPITLDMKATKLSCASKQYFTFTFCPDRKLLNKTNAVCEEGLSFCYEPIMTAEFAKPLYTLNTQTELDVSQKCGELFRGFKVSFKWLFDPDRNKFDYFYEFQLAYQKEPYYFLAPENNCISLWLGNEADLMTSVRDFDKEELYPKMVKKNQYNSQKFGVDNATYSEDWPDTKNNVQLGDKPSLKMLYLDMKSREFVPQMMFTVGANTSCNLYARVRSNKVGKCKSAFKQKTISLRAYGHNTTTTYKLTLESGVNTNSTKGNKSKQEKILDKEFEEGKAEEEEQTDTDEGIQSYDESIEEPQEKVLESATKSSVEEKDVTPAWKKAEAAAINAAAAAGCGLMGALSFGMASCSANVEFKDTQTTSFHEAYAKTSIHNSKTTHSTNSVHSVQTALQTAFTHSKGKSETTSHSEERSMSNAVSTKKIFVWEIAVPAGKIITPMQMAVDCDGSSVTIPWMNFRLQDEKNQIVEEYGDEVVSGDKLGIKSDDEASKDDNDYGPVKAISQQEKDLAEAFEQPPIKEAEEADEYADVLGNEDDGKGKEKKKEDKAKSNEEKEEENVYEGFDGKDKKN